MRRRAVIVLKTKINKKGPQFPAALFFQLTGDGLEIHIAHAAHTAAHAAATPPPDFFSGFSAIMASVVISRPATDAALSSAMRTTLVGSMMPALIMSQYSPFCASKP